MNKKTLLGLLLTATTFLASTKAQKPPFSYHGNDPAEESQPKLEPLKVSKQIQNWLQQDRPRISNPSVLETKGYLNLSDSLAANQKLVCDVAGGLQSFATYPKTGAYAELEARLAELGEKSNKRKEFFSSIDRIASVHDRELEKRPLDLRKLDDLAYRYPLSEFSIKAMKVILQQLMRAGNFTGASAYQARLAWARKQRKESDPSLDEQGRMISASRKDPQQADLFSKLENFFFENSRHKAGDLEWLLRAHRIENSAYENPDTSAQCEVVQIMANEVQDKKELLEKIRKLAKEDPKRADLFIGVLLANAETPDESDYLKSEFEGLRRPFPSLTRALLKDVVDDTDRAETSLRGILSSAATSPEVNRVLEKAASPTKQRGIRVVAWQALNESDAIFPPDSGLLKEAIAGPDNEIRHAAYRHLMKQASSKPEALAALVVGLEDSDPQIALDVARWLGANEQPPQSAGKRLIQLIRSKVPTKKAAGFEGIVRLARRHPAAIDVITQELSSSENAPLAVRALQESDSEFSSAFEATFGNTGIKAPLFEFFLKSNGEEKATALALLGKCSNLNAHQVDELYKATRDQKLGSGSVAWDSLKRSLLRGAVTSPATAAAILADAKGNQVQALPLVGLLGQRESESAGLLMERSAVHPEKIETAIAAIEGLALAPSKSFADTFSTLHKRYYEMSDALNDATPPKNKAELQRGLLASVEAIVTSLARDGIVSQENLNDGMSRLLPTDPQDVEMARRIYFALSKGVENGNPLAQSAALTGMDFGDELVESFALDLLANSKTLGPSTLKKLAGRLPHSDPDTREKILKVLSNNVEKLPGKTVLPDLEAASTLIRIGQKHRRQSAELQARVEKSLGIAKPNQ